MAIGQVMVSLGLNDNEFKKGLNAAKGTVASGIGQMKSMLLAAALGQYLLAGANDAINAAVDQMQAKLNLMKLEGMSEEQYHQISVMAEQFELLGSNAEVAQLKITEFVTAGRATGLRELGIYLTKEEQTMLKTATAAERLQYVMSEFPQYLSGMSEMLPDNVESFILMRKTMDELKEAMGITFLTVVQKITDAFGGIIPAMKAAIIAFTTYKTAMILGNVAIGISKAIALGTVFAAPAAIAMGVAALASLGALMGGAALAVSALNSIPDENLTSAPTTNSNNNQNSQIVVQINQDKFGETSAVSNSAGGSGSSSIQTNYGS